MDKEYAKYLLEKTRQDYNLIAEDFSRTRSYIPEDIKSLKKYVQNGDRILDLGCGNGRLFELFQDKNIGYIGVDNSEKLIGIAKSKYPHPPQVFASQKFGRARGKFLVSSGLNLPFIDNYFDKVFSLAVLHHVPSKEFRLQFLKEIKRLLKPGGLLILTVWNVNPIRMIFTRKIERTISFFKSTILKIFGLSKLDFNDFYIPWRNSCQRYIHYFTKGELRKLAEKTGFKIKKIGISKNPKTKESDLYLIAES